MGDFASSGALLFKWTRLQKKQKIKRISPNLNPSAQVD
jgi:hypothetical protein